MQTFSVSQITGHIYDLFDADSVLADVWVRGEVSNLTIARSGHWYFTIKDADAQLRCVMFRGAARRAPIDVGAGDEILAHGRVSVYAARGEYQLYADTIESVGGLGDLHRQFEALKAKLDAEGLFDPERKKADFRFPNAARQSHLPTAPPGHDIQNVCAGASRCRVVLSRGCQARRPAANRWAAGADSIARGHRRIIIRAGAVAGDLWCSMTKGWRGRWRTVAFRVNPGSRD